MLAQAPKIVFADRIGFDVSGGHARRAELAAFEYRRAFLVADDELDAPAADVDDQVRLILQFHRVSHGQVNQPRFFALLTTRM